MGRAARVDQAVAEEAEFRDVFVAVFPQAFAVARRLLQDRSAAEDVAAEALARAFARWPDVRALPYRDAWILRVTTNLCLNQLARRQPTATTAAYTPEHDTVVVRLALVDALRHLSKRQREIIVLRHIAGFSEADIAHVLGINEGTVKTHTKRAIAALRARLGDDFTGVGDVV